ncbi:LamG-like jellyroll fold domain-containing protein [Luteolibacter marinus]|uniref:LamG-like jellyroll fold domain-containing protein n=1 Tax=Luteolibacter marinus TaxID=2776705 RepID=UPI0018691EDD|nr:LamG-like jellyroll fold domain-containing protein [Luteolibacter marinus]
MKSNDKLPSSGVRLRNLALATAAVLASGTSVRADLVGHWFSGDENLSDTSGFTAPGTHDGVAVGGNAGLLAFSSDLPPGFTGGMSLDLTAGNVAVQIDNSANTDAGYLNTFDEGVGSALTVAFWAKGFPGNWAPWVSKRGEDNIGWQVRRMGGDPIAGFTVRGLNDADGWGSTINVNDNPPVWHHFTAVWDQADGSRTLYVDGELSHVIYNPLEQTMALAPGKHLALGGRQGGAADFDSYFSGLLFDVRIFNSALSQEDVYDLIPQLAPEGLTATPGLQKVNLTWSPSAGATEYTVWTKNTVTDEETTDVVLEPPFLKTGLTNGVPYLFKVLGSNGGGSGPYSAEVGATPAAGTAKDIVYFEFFDFGPAKIEGTGITKYVPLGTDVTDLFVVYDVSPFATEDFDHPSWDSRDFTTPQTYTITAEDGSTKDFTVTVLFSDPIVYDFDSGLQDWTQIWPVPGDLWENGGLGTPEGPSADGAETRFGRSPDFFLDPSGPLSFQLAGGQGALEQPGVGPSDIPQIAASDNGFSGVALRDVESNTYVLSRRRTGNGPGYVTHSFSEEELAPFIIEGKRYTLDFIDYNKGGWGWARLDNVSIPGELAPVIPPTPEAKITSFSHQGAAIISGTNITLPALPFGSSVTALAPTYTLSAGATCDKPSGSIQDFTNPVTYTVTSSDLLVVEVYTVSVSVLPDPATALVGHWVSGNENLADESGYTVAGTHDGVAVGGNAGLLAYSTDVPAGFSGKSLDLSAGNVAVMIENSSTSDPSYLNTFDDTIRSQITVAFWAKGFPGEWSPWVAKGGEGGIGWQVRRVALDPVAGFTVRGLGNEDHRGSTVNVDDTEWHHFAGVWDETTGVRSLYVDGVLSHDVNTLGDVMNLATGQHLVLGGRQTDGVNYSNYFAGKLFDVRIYKQKLFAGEVQALTIPTGLYSTWVNTNYPGLADKSPGADPDGDGMTNEDEFAFGLDPGNPGSVNPIVILPDAATGEFSYQRLHPDLSGLTCTIMVSTNLIDWDPDLAATAGQSVSATNGDVQTMSATLSAAPPGSTKLFVRVIAE